MDKSAENTKPIKNRKIFETILTVVLVVLIVIGFGVSGVLIYQKRYLTPFWVNGQSMYPTLNHDITDLSGNRYEENGGSIHGDGALNVDYGVMDCHASAINKIKRFDIVVCTYSSNDLSDKIKRVVGLPGETIKFTASNDEHNGELNVMDGDGNYKVIEQPIDPGIVRSGLYSSNIYVLGSDEYFVVGDNRLPGKSNDSRSVGPISKNFIEGKVVAIVAHCEAHKSGSDYKISNINYFSWPRFL